VRVLGLTELVQLHSEAHLKRMLVPVLKAQLRLRGVAAAGEKKDLIEALVKHLKLPPKKEPVKLSTAEGAALSLTRNKNFHIHVCKRWDGAGMGGGGSTLREQLVALCHEAFPGSYTDEGVIGLACDYSSYFHGLYNLIHLEIYVLATRPFVQWQLGNFRPFLDVLPAMAQLIATAPRKTTIVRCFLFQVERVAHYAKNQPDVLRHMGKNCTMLREDHIENHHAVLTHWVNKHVKLVRHKHYLHASGIVRPAGDAKRTFSDLFSRRSKREQEQEEDRILARTDKASYADTNRQLDEWVLGPFRAILLEKKTGGAQPRNPKFSDTRWTREAVTARQTSGQSRLENSLVLYEKFLASVGPATAAVAAGVAAADGGAAAGGGVAAGGGAAAGVSALRAYLEGLAIAGKSPVTLRAECQRRGLKVSGTKPELVERVEAHAIANRGGYRCATTGAAVADGKPKDFTGGIPAAPNGAAAVGV
jgi:hypothetical protein